MQTTIHLDNPSLFIHAFDNASIGMAIEASDGTLLKVNHALCNILGYHESELTSISFKDITYAVDLENNLSLMSDTIRGKIKSYHMEKRLIHKKGYLITVLLSVSLVRDNHDQPMYFISQVQDITDQKFAEEMVNEGEKQYRSLVEGLPDAIIILSKNGECIYVNETGVNLLGAIHKHEIIGRTCCDFIFPKDRQRLNESFNRTINGETLDETDETLLGIDGNPVDVQILPAYFEDKSSVLLIMKDISQKKKTEELILNFDKLTVAGQLAAGIAHEVRNPLTAIKGFLQIIKSESMKNKEYLDVIFSELSRIEDMLGELLILARPQGTKFTSTDLKFIIDDVITLIDSQAKLNNIEIQKCVESDIPSINCDGNQLKQVFINLVKNAIEAMPKGGTILVTIKNQNNDVLITIKDQGGGIPDHLLKRMGEPFFTTKENGTGLGLMVCHQIIKNHNGRMDFINGSEGTVVKVLLSLS